MKKYICVDDLKRYPYAFGIEAAIADLPKVTNADICREFVKRIKEMFDFCSKNAMGIIDVDIAKGLVDKVLAEMENEE